MLSLAKKCNIPLCFIFFNSTTNHFSFAGVFYPSLTVRALLGHFRVACGGSLHHINGRCGKETVTINCLPHTVLTHGSDVYLLVLVRITIAGCIRLITFSIMWKNAKPSSYGQTLAFQFTGINTFHHRLERF